MSLAMERFRLGEFSDTRAWTGAAVIIWTIITAATLIRGVGMYHHPRQIGYYSMIVETGQRPGLLGWIVIPVYIMSALPQFALWFGRHWSPLDALAGLIFFCVLAWVAMQMCYAKLPVGAANPQVYSALRGAGRRANERKVAQGMLVGPRQI